MGILDWILTIAGAAPIALLHGVLAIVYVLLKIVIKAGLRSSVGSTYDYRDAVCWFCVDVSVLTLVLSMNDHLHIGNQQETEAWYVVLVAVLIVTLVLYGLFVRFWSKEWKWRARACIAANLLICYAPFLKVIQLIGGAKP